MVDKCITLLALQKNLEIEVVLHVPGTTISFINGTPFVDFLKIYSYRLS